MYVFVVGPSKQSDALARQLFHEFQLVPPQSQEWNTLLCHLAHGLAFDQIVSAVARQQFNLFYGFPWSHPACEIVMREAFPDALWIKAEATADCSTSCSTSCCLPDCDVILEGESRGKFTAVDVLTSLLPLRTFAPPWPFPCSCSRASHVIHSDWFPENTRCFHFRTPDAAVQEDYHLYVDWRFRYAVTEHRRKNIAWLVESEAIVPGCSIAMRDAASSFHRSYHHRSSFTNPEEGVIGHVPYGGCCISPEDSARAATTIKKPVANLVASSKTYAPGHALRHAIIQASLPEDRLQVFGHSVNKFIANKAEAHLPFMYAVIIENVREPGYWSEKLVDGLVCRCVVFYWGPPDVYDWFLPGSIIAFENITELEALLDTMSTEDYESRRAALDCNQHRALASYGLGNLAIDTDLLSLPAAIHICPCNCPCNDDTAPDFSKLWAGESGQ